jgi:hypothetical protein
MGGEPISNSYVAAERHSVQARATKQRFRLEARQVRPIGSTPGHPTRSAGHIHAMAMFATNLQTAFIISSMRDAGSRRRAHKPPTRTSRNSVAASTRRSRSASGSAGVFFIGRVNSTGAMTSPACTLRLVPVHPLTRIYPYSDPSMKPIRSLPKHASAACRLCG